MSKAKFEAAKELIQEKKYSEARTILQTIDHPLAKEWLAKVDALSTPAVTFPKVQPKKTKRRSPWLLLVLLGGIGCCLFAAITPRSTTPQTEPTVSGASKAAISKTDAPPATEIPFLTQTTDQLILSAMANVVNQNDKVDYVGSDQVTVEFDLSDLSAHFALFDAQTYLPKIACALRTLNLKTKKYLIIGKLAAVDKFGNTSRIVGATATIAPATLAQFNCKSDYGINIAKAADTYFVSPLIADAQ